MCGSRGEDRGSGPPPPPMKNHKHIGFSSNTGPDPLKIAATKPAFNLGWSIIGAPAKRHLMAFCWRTDDGPLIVVLGFLLPSSTKKKLSKLDPSDKTFWIRACLVQQTLGFLLES